MKIANIKSANLCNIVFDCSMEDLKLLEKMDPKALCIFDEDDNVIFKVASTSGIGSVSKYGVAFGKKTADNKLAVNITLPDDDADEYIVDEFGDVILSLSKIESRIADAVSAAKEARNGILEMIEEI